MIEYNKEQYFSEHEISQIINIQNSEILTRRLNSFMYMDGIVECVLISDKEVYSSSFQKSFEGDHFYDMKENNYSFHPFNQNVETVYLKGFFMNGSVRDFKKENQLLIIIKPTDHSTINGKSNPLCILPVDMMSFAKSFNKKVNHFLSSSEYQRIESEVFDLIELHGQQTSVSSMVQDRTFKNGSFTDDYHMMQMIVSDLSSTWTNSTSTIAKYYKKSELEELSIKLNIDINLSKQTKSKATKKLTNPAKENYEAIIFALSRMVMSMDSKLNIEAKNDSISDKRVINECYQLLKSLCHPDRKEKIKSISTYEDFFYNSIKNTQARIGLDITKI